MVKGWIQGAPWRCWASWLTLLGALHAAPVSAGWTEATVPGELNDVQIWSPGDFTVSTHQGAFHFVDGVQEGGAHHPGADVVGAFWELSGCVSTIVGPTGAVRSSCGSESSIEPGVIRVRHVEQGGPGYVGFNNLGAQIGIHSYSQGVSPASSGIASTVDDLFAPLWPMDVVVPASASFPIGAFLVDTGDASIALTMAEASSRLTFTPHVLWGTPQPVAPIREVELLVQTNGDVNRGHVFLAAADALYRVDTSPVGSGWTPHVRVEAAPAGQSIEGVALSEDRAGFATTQGHGMLLLWDGSRTHLRRAVPEFRGATPGTEWVAATTGFPAAPSGMTPRLVSCEGAHTCVIGHSDGNQTHLAIYRNEAGPTPVLTPSAATLPEGTAAVFTVSGLADPDGDPLAVRWRIRHGAQEVPFVLTPDTSRATVDTTGFEVCGGPEPLNVQLEVSDGLSAHEVPLDRTISVSRSRSPKIAPDGGRLEAGVPVALEVLPHDFAVCLPTEYAWEVTGPASLSATSGSVTTLTVAGPACSPDGATVTVEASALGTGGWVPSAPATFLVPAWGPAPEPFATATIEQHAGTSQTYSARPHACSGSPEFPGQQTEWTLRGALPEGVTLVGTDGQPIDPSAGPFTASALRVETDSCAEGTLTFDVVTEVEGVGDTEARGTLRVDVIRFAPPIAEADLSLALRRFEGGVLAGRLDTDVSCPDRAGWRASLVVLREGAPVMEPIRVSPEGDFELNVPALCSGGQFMLQATLEDPNGVPGVTREAPFEATPAPARVGRLVDSEVRAACGEGARGALTLQPPAGSCLGAKWTWTQLDGPSLIESVLHGRNVRVQSAGERELAELVGSTLRFEVVAEAEGLASDTQVIEVPIGSELLVEVAGRAETALARDDSFFGAHLEVRNITRCRLSGLEVDGVLAGAAPVGGEVSVSGTTRPATWDAPRLTIRDVTLEEAGEASLELLLKPSLLGPEHVRLAGEVHLNGVRVSLGALVEGGPERPTGCGCNGTGGTGWAFPAILAALFFSSRSRR